MPPKANAWNKAAHQSEEELEADTVALLLSLLAGLGVGSAGLFVLFLTLVQGLSQIRAQAANLLLFLF